MAIRTISSAATMLAATCLCAPVWAASIPGGFSSVVVFGDSLSDTGRVKDLVESTTGGGLTYPPPPYYEGRFTNGPNYVDRLQSMWGLTQDVDLLNYAFGGASAVPRGDVIIDLGQQVREFQRAGAPGASGAIGIMNIGGNDVIEAAYASGGNAFRGTTGIAGDETDPDLVDLAEKEAKKAGRKAANAVKRQITRLGETGLSSFLLYNLADVGDTPRFADPNEAGTNPLTGESAGRYATLGSDAFNRRLARNADMLRTMGFEIIDIDVATRVEEIFADPGSVGLSDTTSSCGTFIGASAGLGLSEYDFSDDTCDESNPESITAPFWDDLHPTALLHQEYALLTDQALRPVASSLVLAASGTTTPVPVPAPVLLLAGGLAVLAGLRRRR